jgi:hypothetical protein
MRLLNYYFYNAFNYNLKEKTNMKTVFLVLFLSLVMSSCKSDEGLFPPDELSLNRADYIGDELKIDGYYYNDVDGTFFAPTFFYRNGIFIYTGGAFDSFDKMDNYIKDEFISRSDYKESIFRFGLFLIDGNIIKFELIYPSSGGPLKAFVNEGVILNDTTFLIQSSYRNQNGKITEFREENETYHFREFSPKPDSTNSFVP